MEHPCLLPAFRRAAGLLVTVLCLALLAAMPREAQAGASEWVQVEGGEVRIVAARPLSDGTIPAILDIRLKPGWKTYWREPGASGIPPQVTVNPLSGIIFTGLLFPAPKTFDDGVVHYTGYDRSVALPMQLQQLKPGSAVDLKASVFLGICKDICIPVQAELAVSLPAGAAGNPLEQARIDDAKAALPGAPAADFKVTETIVDTAAKTLQIRFMVPDGTQDVPEIFLAGPAGFSFGKPLVKVASGGGFTADIPYRSSKKGGNLTGRTAVLVLRAGPRSIETSLAFE
ncbi:protein-disulfide reductase DsbD family protein [Rhizobium sp. 32-5/1]|uniref:protein-disulfide reductase DsbD domain-containing protein n=1 Tax=Rhizobium sp. 32-5/1 TaxID=3019602 RepID=UPI00240E864D|nr:protein-disulfide reductase DsbD domain-containing protein [Rhizobium sp. 32-5/1]WEZ84135.1 protein-disulfide reductase DsbD family protein [Rhizobium sp. 32-5/1]